MIENHVRYTTHIIIKTQLQYNTPSITFIITTTPKKITLLNNNNPNKNIYTNQKSHTKKYATTVKNILEEAILDSVACTTINCSTIDQKRHLAYAMRKDIQ